MSLFYIFKIRKVKTKLEVLGRTTRLLSFDTIRASKKETPPTILRCHGNAFTEPLPSNDRMIHRETNRISFILTDRRETTPPTILRCRGNVFAKPLPSNDRRIHRESHRLSFIRTDRRETTPPTILRCRGNVFTKPLPSNNTRGYTYRYTDW
jgi:hypothetical protein